ncbi:MAG: amidohydrolase family protein [Phycisphaerae bacterium]|nr:amidohydrolase family protein [Phycisphaerae bacterium]
MIVDTHTHLWQSPDQLGPQIGAQLRQVHSDLGDGLDASSQAHEQATSCVDVAFVLGFRSVHLGADISNDLIASYVQTAPHRLIGFAGIDPMEDGSLEQVDRLASMGLSGVVISPCCQCFHPGHTRAMALYEKCQAHSLPVLVHYGSFYTRDAALEYAQPVLLDEVARAFPQLKLVLLQCGHPFIEQALTLIGKHGNVYAEISGVVSRPWQLYNTLIMAHQCHVTDRLLFGSGFPEDLPERAIETVYSIHRISQGIPLPSVPRERLRSIVERDVMSVLGLKQASVTSATATVELPPSPKPTVESQSGAGS